MAHGPEDPVAAVWPTRQSIAYRVEGKPRASGADVTMHRNTIRDLTARSRCLYNLVTFELRRVQDS